MHRTFGPHLSYSQESVFPDVYGDPTAHSTHGNATKVTLPTKQEHRAQQPVLGEPPPPKYRQQDPSPGGLSPGGKTHNEWSKSGKQMSLEVPGSRVEAGLITWQGQQEAQSL